MLVRLRVGLAATMLDTTMLYLDFFYCFWATFIKAFKAAATAVVRAVYSRLHCVARPSLTTLSGSFTAGEKTDAVPEVSFQGNVTVKQAYGVMLLRVLCPPASQPCCIP